MLLYIQLTLLCDCLFHYKIGKNLAQFALIIVSIVANCTEFGVTFTIFSPLCHSVTLTSSIVMIILYTTAQLPLCRKYLSSYSSGM